MKKIIKRIFILASLLGFLILPYFVFADSPLNALQNVGVAGGYNKSTNQTTISVIAGAVVSTVLSLLGIIFIALIVYAGIIWMTAEGDEAKVEKAQKILRNAIIGLVITVGVYGIYALVRSVSFAVSG
ncbi:MAG: hypothetical protein PHE24_00500 [Patescibacteria group bacterium]|nr:hypothetical protein [Patescibacteria group bacterium]